jgi:hydroxylamine reductase
VEGRKVGIVDHEVNDFTSKALFSTLTNVSFDPERFETLVRKGLELRDNLAKKVKAAGGNISSPSEPARFLATGTLS